MSRSLSASRSKLEERVLHIQNDVFKTGRGGLSVSDDADGETIEVDLDLSIQQSLIIDCGNTHQAMVVLDPTPRREVHCQRRTLQSIVHGNQ